MRKLLLNLLAVVAILIADFSTSEVYSQQTLTQINGWNAYVHLPAGYNSNTNTYPTIIFFPVLAKLDLMQVPLSLTGPGPTLRRVGTVM